MLIDLGQVGAIAGSALCLIVIIAIAVRGFSKTSGNKENSTSKDKTDKSK